MPCGTVAASAVQHLDHAPIADSLYSSSGAAELLPCRRSREAMPNLLAGAMEGGTSANGHPCRIAQAMSFLDTNGRRCYSRKGQVCNKKELGQASPKDEELDERMRHLQADLQLKPKMFVRGEDVMKNIEKANEKLQVEHGDVEKSARAFEKRRSAFEGAFDNYKKVLATWKKATANLEDDYTLHCRPFHDVTMECEAKWRAAMRSWAAREPLPECLVGVVTPFPPGEKQGSVWTYF